MRPRHLLALAVLVVASLIAVPGAAHAVAGPATHVVTAAKQAKPAKAAKSKAAKSKAAKSKKAKKAKKAKFTATGWVTAVDVDARTVTMRVKGGTKALRGATVTVTVSATAKVVVEEARGPLSAVEVGYRVTAVGVRTGDGLIATKLKASTPEPGHPEGPEGD